MHRWTDGRGGSRIDYQRYYHEWLFGRKTLSALCTQLGRSYPTLQKQFDALPCQEGVLYDAPAEAINLLIDATFFGRDYGFLCFHDTEKVMYCQEITTETAGEVRKGLRALQQAGYRIKSVTIDGRRGYYTTIKQCLGPVPIQMCLYHQKAIIRRYITDKPKSLCGQELKALMKSLCSMDCSDFIHACYQLKEKHQPFLRERNEKKGFKHKNLRAAFRSIQYNLPYLFTYKDIPDANIPPTNNHLEGTFAHLKEKITLHRGLSLHRKKKAIKFILASPPLF